jgi:NAD(P)-dependent dehydrogenase (short-subunit alcohol dehydrogenase family)
MFENKTAIVTGGASGIGEELVRQLHRRGARVIIVDSDDVNGRRVQAAVGTADRPVRFEHLDVRDAAALEGLVAGLERAGGRVDFMFNNAGIAILALAQDMSLHDWKHFLDVNLLGVVGGVHAVFARMVAQGSGHIINTASLAGLVPVPGCASYVAAKSAVVGLSQALRIEGASHGVRVSVVCPGMVETPIFERTHCVGLDPQKVKAAMPGRPTPVDVFVRRVLRGVAKNRSVIAPGVAGVLWRLHRYLPWLTTALMRSLHRKLLALREPSA